MPSLLTPAFLSPQLIPLNSLKKSRHERFPSTQRAVSGQSPSLRKATQTLTLTSRFKSSGSRSHPRHQVAFRDGRNKLKRSISLSLRIASVFKSVIVFHIWLFLYSLVQSRGLQMIKGTGHFFETLSVGSVPGAGHS